MQEFGITNDTMELADVKDQWYFDEDYQVWCLEDLVYTPKAKTPKFQRMSIFVPAAYMSAPGEVNEEGAMGDYTAKTAPVIFENNSAGYMQMPQTYLGGPRDMAPQYLEAGMVYVSCGSRGVESKDPEGVPDGKSPYCLIDLKMGIRFLRHNKANLPGDFDKVISVGWSAGGAMSSLLAVTGDHKDYDSYLEEEGAFMDESDSVYAAQIYCPIADLDHADLAYEWQYHNSKTSEDCPSGPSETMTPFKDALSSILSDDYIKYFNDLKLQNLETGEVLTLNEDGRSGSGYDYLMKILEDSATKFLKKVDMNAVEEITYSAEDYVNGNYTYMTQILNFDDDEGPDEPPKDENMAHFAGAGVSLDAGGPPEGKEPAEPPSLGDLMARPPRGVPFVPGVEPQDTEVPGKDNSAWLSWNGEHAKIKDLDTYLLNHRQRMKPCTAFDAMSDESNENRLFGECNEEKDFMHFDTYVAPALEELKDQFPDDYAEYYEPYCEALNNPEQEKCKYLYNPFNYVTQPENTHAAKYDRIRVGASDADTAFTISMALACKMKEYGADVNYELVWDKPHCEADYPGEVIDWIKGITL